jgi:hypothetical protein
VHQLQQEEERVVTKRWWLSWLSISKCASIATRRRKRKGKGKKKGGLVGRTWSSIAIISHFEMLGLVGLEFRKAQNKT